MSTLHIALLLADAYDVYVTPRGVVRLVDINPVGGTTSPLLFDWAELPYDHRMQSAALDGIGPHLPRAEVSNVAEHICMQFCSCVA